MYCPPLSNTACFLPGLPLPAPRPPAAPSPLLPTATSKGSLSLVTDPMLTIWHLPEHPGAYMLTGSVYTPDKANMRRRVPWAQGQPIVGSR